MSAACTVAAPALAAIIALSSYFAILCVESLRFRPHKANRSFDFFEAELRPRLGFEIDNALNRFTLLRQVGLILLSMDLLYLGSLTQSIEYALAEALLLTVTVMVVFSQIVPSILVTRTEGRWALRFAGVAKALAWSIQPIVLLSSFASSVLALGAEEEEEKPAHGGGEIAALLDAGEEEGLIDDGDRKLIQSVVEFGDKTVREVMTPRPRVVAIEAGRSLEDVRRLMLAEEYSRIPVYRGDIDNVVGFLHSRDTLEIDREERRRTPLDKALRAIALVPETKHISELMRELQESNAQMAVVIDEYGQTAGLVTMEDMMEEIVGEIRDESDPDRDVSREADGSFTASGNLDLDRLEELADFRPSEDLESTTLGGLVCEHLGQVPAAGARLHLDGLEIEVLAADERRVNQVRVRRRAGREEGGEVSS